MDSGVIGGVSAAVLVPLIFFGLSRIRTLRIEIPPDVSVERLEAEYRPWERKAIGLYVAAAVPCGLLIFFVLRGLSSLISAGLDGVYLFQPGDPVRSLYALFLGLALPAFPLERLLERWMGPEKFREYQLYDAIRAANLYRRQSAGLDMRKVGKGLMISLLIVVAITLPLTLDSYTVVSEQGIALNRYASLGVTRYPWKEVTAVTNVVSFRAPNGRPVRNPSFKVTFANGDVWDMFRSVAAPPKERQAEVAAFIARKSGRSIVIEDPFPDARPSGER
ncbi:MAG: hypothetical protein SFU56_13230 [Capsulimonadales bacterium]|nr:hypothetical protein [Capsulimonadales bacterium]